MALAGSVAELAGAVVALNMAATKTGHNARLLDL